MKKFGLILLAAFLSACDSDKVFEENIALENYVWSVENHPKFLAEITDTLSEMKIIVNTDTALITHSPIFGYL